MDSYSDALMAWLLGNPVASLAVGLGLLCLSWVFVHLGTRGDPPPGKVGKPLPRVRTSGYRPRGAVFIPFELGQVTIDLQPTAQETMHVVLAGISGLGKSTTVLPLLDLPIGVLVVALDNTRPIARRIRELPDGIEWTNEPDWPVGLDLTAGEGRIVAEVLVEGWAARTSQDTGKYREIAQERLAGTIRQVDAGGLPRSLPELARGLWERTGDAEVDRACRDWAGRLVRLHLALGEALGGDLDLVQAMRERKKVLLRLNRFLNPRLAPMVGGMLLVHARRTAQAAGVPFVLVIEEAGQMGLYQEQIVPLAQAARDRGVPTIILTQNATKLPIEVINNVRVWVSFAQEAQAERRELADHLRLDPEQLKIEAFPWKGLAQGVGWAYVRAPGVPVTLVQLKPYVPARVPAARAPGLPATSAGRSAGAARRTTSGSGASTGREQWQVLEGGAASGGLEDAPRRESDGWRPWTLALEDAVEAAVSAAEPSPQPRREPVPDWIGLDPAGRAMWDECERVQEPAILWSPSRGTWVDERGCLRWIGGYQKPRNGAPPRPRKVVAQRDVTPYRWFFERRHGHPADPTYDHLCGHPWCCEVEHGEACSFPENNARNTPRKTAFEAAGWQLVADPLDELVLGRWRPPAALRTSSGGGGGGAESRRRAATAV